MAISEQTDGRDRSDESESSDASAEVPARQPDTGQPDEVVGDGPDVLRFLRPPDILTYLIAGGFTLMSMLVVVGGLTGIFPTELVAAVIAIYGPTMGSVAYFYYRRRPGA